MPILMPNQKPKEKEESDFDKLLKGLSVVKDVTGVYTDFKKIEEARAERDQNKAKEDREKTLFNMKQEEYNQNKAGALGPKELSEMDVSQAPKSGFAQALDRATGKTIYVKKRESNANALDIQNKTLDIAKKTRELNDPYNQVSKVEQEVVGDLAKKNAAKTSIANQIDSAVTQLDDPKINEEQKLTLARTLLKTLNSAEGADAIGAEEAKRLGSLIEYQVFNFTQPGPFFGRAPISDFSTQAKGQSKSIKDAITANEAEIAKRLGVPPIATKTKPPPTPEEAARILAERNKKRMSTAGQ